MHLQNIGLVWSQNVYQKHPVLTFNCLLRPPGRPEKETARALVNYEVRLVLALGKEVNEK